MINSSSRDHIDLSSENTLVKLKKTYMPKFQSYIEVLNEKLTDFFNLLFSYCFCHFIRRDLTLTGKIGQ